MTEKIYDWFLTTDAKKFIFFSSVKAAADKVEGEILTEDVVPSPKGPYGESKIKAESYIMSQCANVLMCKESIFKNQESRIGKQETKAEAEAKGQELVENSELQTTDYLLPTTH